MSLLEEDVGSRGEEEENELQEEEEFVGLNSSVCLTLMEVNRSPKPSYNKILEITMDTEQVSAADILASLQTTYRISSPAPNEIVVP